MNKRKWKKITEAALLLGLKDRASLLEVKKAYRRMCKKCHPDVADSGKIGGQGIVDMHELTEAYQILLNYCTSYRCPLSGKAEEVHDAEDWWMDRFGQDPLWGKGGKGDI